MTPLDKLGRTIMVGDWIVYAHALGRSAALKIGRVLEIRCVEPTWRTQPPWRIRVAGYDESAYRDTRVTRGTLLFPDRAIVVEQSAVPEHVRDALEDLSCAS